MGKTSGASRSRCGRPHWRAFYVKAGQGYGSTSIWIIRATWSSGTPAKMGLEGIVSKRLGSYYHSGRTRGPENMRWFWSMTVNGPMTRADRVGSLEETKAGVNKCWDEWKAWAKLEEAE